MSGTRTKRQLVCSQQDIKAVKDLVSRYIRQSSFQSPCISIADMMRTMGPQVAAYIHENGREFAEALTSETGIDIEDWTIDELPCCPEFHRSTIPTSEDMNKFITLGGVVSRVQLPKLIQASLNFKCNSCSSILCSKAQPAFFNKISKPKFCSICKGLKILDTSSKSSDSKKLDYQEILLKESHDNSAIPRSIWIALRGRLVDQCHAGDRVIVSGLVQSRWTNEKQWDISELFIVANSINKDLTAEDRQSVNITIFWSQTDANPDYLRSKILSSIPDSESTKCPSTGKQESGEDHILRDFLVSNVCPKLYGMYLIKLSVALLLVGGCNSRSKQRPRPGTISSTACHIDNIQDSTRSDIHLLLIGDPGLGKSQLLNFVHELVGQRSVITTGIGTSSAGLTATACREGGDWQLDPGALVLSNGGVCCIDEFTSIKYSDLACIHEAMEQQSISIAKAGIVCKLKTQCALLACCNPSDDIAEATNLDQTLAGPLLSRFDLIMTMSDSTDNDEQTSSHLLSQHRVVDQKQLSRLAEGSIKLSFEDLRNYLKTAKTIQPEISEPAFQVIRSYYAYRRSVINRNTSRTTVRLLESLVRLTEAHARLLLRQRATVEDCIAAICLLELSAQQPIVTLKPCSDRSLSIEQYQLGQKIINAIGLDSFDRSLDHGISTMTRSATFEKSPSSDNDVTIHVASQHDRSTVTNAREVERSLSSSANDVTIHVASQHDRSTVTNAREVERSLSSSDNDVTIHVASVTRSQRCSSQISCCTPLTVSGSEDSEFKLDADRSVATRSIPSDGKSLRTASTVSSDARSQSADASASIDSGHICYDLSLPDI